ncbi:MAG TPA: pyridoxal phosphate-dependent aminotransferase [Thermodesulfobacteriota bacterium]|nr:pyridoxal phosphate-dependent aminotransferase [Thermodesulfobacteriota bacterium]
MKLAERLGEIKPSLTLAVDSKAKAMKKAGQDVISFGVGEPDFDTPEHIKEAAVKAIKEGFTKYTPVSGIDELREAVAARFKEDLGLEYSPKEVVITCGGKHALYNIAQALWGPGDEVIVPAPYWVSYPPMIYLAGATPVILPTKEENEFLVTPEELKSAITPKTRAIILNSPSNPTGSVYTKADLEKLARVILDHDLTIISDDIYDKILFDGLSFTNLAMLSPALKERTLIVNGVSKAYSMTGWRIGYVAGPGDVIGAIDKIQSHSTSNPTSIAQKASVTALTGPQDFIGEMVTEFDRRRKYIVDRLRALPGVKTAMPKGAFYVFPNFSAYYGRKIGGQVISGSLDLADYLLEKGQIAVVPGVAFGEDGCIRFSYATSMALIEKGLDRLEKALKEL